MKKIISFLKFFLFIFRFGIEEVADRIESFSYDQLTGLHNRRSLKERKGDYLIVFIDLDGFKEINDSLGYKEGDDVLKEFAQILKKCSRKDDIFVRWGGDEFLLILPETSKEGANTLLNRIKDQSRKSSHVTEFSFGVAKNEKNLSETIEKASRLMQKMKKGKRGAI